MKHSLTNGATRRRGPVVFLVLACLGMWLAMAPLLIGGFQRGDAREETGTLAEVCISAAMFAPALAALLVIRFVEPGGRLRDVLALRWPRPWGRGVRACLAGLAVPAGLTVAALALGSATGAYPLGEVHWRSVGGWAAGMLVQILLSLPLFFGEELGWQGYLFPRLARAGRGHRLVAAYLLTGAAFALWHLPTLLMGGQYPGRPWYVSVPAMVVSCTLILPVFTWLRLRSDSVLPAVLAHAFVSTASVGMVKEFADPGAPLDPLRMGLTGWPGWIAVAAFVTFLALTGRLRLPPTTPTHPPRTAHAPRTPATPGTSAPRDGMPHSAPSASRVRRVGAAHTVADGTEVSR
ncbi:CPBP family intramembrane metalloprotease [Streptomyces sp. RS10V-4]|uniref:CPBP family intramembrane glutamic endopeptidase n=1 Tax=Streptomyces rhizoryzae TaxID=2932493 RepID=UPI0020036F12|nr:CPBP family intramembrane glutamic endopeptidase [Streptomyces rhizoryzae]MCK7626083.1 CPBP family intramembrane metalloprotease [Streptomyces rhizoryzae]